MGVRQIRKAALTTILGAGAVVFQGCPVGGLVGPLMSDCFGENTISEQAFDDMNALEQLLYDRNDCGRYEPRSSLLDDLL